MSYLEFLLLFVAGPTLLLGLVAWRRASAAGQLARSRWHWWGTGILAAIAFIWTTPWDNYIVANGVWSYGEERVLGVIGYVPIEEYLFFILMPLLNGAFFALCFPYGAQVNSTWKARQTVPRLLWVIAGLSVMLTAGLLWRNEQFTYLSTTLLWFVPPLLTQWLFDPGALARNFKVLLTATLAPTLYLSVADTYAIRNGIWTIHDATRTGWEIASLPIEEALFFFITSLLLAQGLTLWHSLSHR